MNQLEVWHKVSGYSITCMTESVCGKQPGNTEGWASCWKSTTCKDCFALKRIYQKIKKKYRYQTATVWSDRRYHELH